MRTVYKCLKQKYRVIKFDVWGLQVIKGKIHLQNLVLRCIHKQFIVWEKTLEGTARYAGLNLASAEGFGQGHFLCVQKYLFNWVAQSMNKLIHIHSMS